MGLCGQLEPAADPRSQMLTYTGKVAAPCHQSQHEHRQLSMLLSALAKPSPEVWGAGASSISEAE